MLKALIALLLMANAAYLAWSQGWLESYGWAPASASEPGRLKQQIKPEAIVLLSAAQISEIEMKLHPRNPPSCLQAGLFDDDQAAVLRAALTKALPDGGWQLDARETPGRWIIYMGKLTTPELMAKKRSQLQARKLSFEPVTSGPLAPGLSLGAFDSKVGAETALAGLVTQGVHTARVEQERPAVQGNMLRLPAADDAIKTALEGVKDALAGHSLETCP